MFSSIAHISKGFELTKTTPVAPVKFNLHCCYRNAGRQVTQSRSYADDLQQISFDPDPADWLAGDQVTTINPTRRSQHQ